MTRRTARTSARESFERSYAAGLGRHVRHGGPGAVKARIGHLPATLRIGILQLARIHDRAVASLSLTPESAARQEAFFAAAVAPIEQANCGTGEALLAFARLAARLGRRTGELASARARLAEQTTRGKSLRAELDAQARDQDACLDRARVMETRLRRLSHRLLSAQEDERLRISRDLHDAIGQELAGINVGLAALKQGAAADSRELGTAITLTQQLVERSMKTVHHYAWELRPTVLDDLGLVPALRSYVKAFTARTGIPVRFASSSKSTQPDADRSLALFRVAQGALSNVERHARAKHARLSLKAVPGAVRLEVSDDGRSFDVHGMETAKKERHLGLLVMRERVEMVGGTFSIVSSATRGTTVRADVPLSTAGAPE